jgi:alkylhydroperoxidase family enzyme
VLRDLDTAPIAEGLRAALRFLRTMTLTPDELVAADAAACIAAGVDKDQLRDAIYVAVAFNTIVRLADSFRFTLLDDDGYKASARSLLRFGYRV